MHHIGLEIGEKFTVQGMEGVWTVTHILSDSIQCKKETNMAFTDFVIKSHPTGSYYICNPPVEDTDIDTVVLIKSGYEPYDALLNEGWVMSESEEYDNLAGEFTSYRKDNENYIVTNDKKFYARFVAATKIAKLLNLLDKADRIKLFEAVLYNKWEPEPTVGEITFAQLNF